jgi:hypothetical protein
MLLQVGFFAEAGPLSVFVSRVVSSIRGQSPGLRATARPAPAWLRQGQPRTVCPPALCAPSLLPQHIPGDMEYNPESMSFTSAVTTGRIKSESKVRVKVVGSSVQATTLCAIGSINEPFLGLLE